MFGEDPHGLHEKWTQQGLRLIEEAKKSYFPGNKNVTDNDAAHQIIRMLCFVLIPEGEDLDTLVSEAVECARSDYNHLQWSMAARDKDAR